MDTILKNVKNRQPLVHFITNYVTVNDVANMMLACGGSPIMTDELLDVEEITSICNALVINIGTIQDNKIPSMIAAGKRANELGHPVILDPVGAGASHYRTDVTMKLLKEIQFTVIRGNISEIKTIYNGSGTTKGVDANLADSVTEDNILENINFARELSRLTGAVIAITGAIDLIVDEQEAYVVRNGIPMMARITGTGCMLTGVIAAYVAANMEERTKATAAAIIAEGLCGEIAGKKVESEGSGTSSFRMYLIDAMSNLEESTLKNGAKFECL